MCGIAGLFAFHPEAPPVETDALAPALAVLAPRGPDGEGLWASRSGRLLLGHRRLAVIDPSPLADQPMASACGRFRLVFNGEIYNHAALRSALQAKGEVFHTAGSDSEVLLALFAREGAACLDRLQGMYAFAIHDAAENSLFLARDPHGIKPLFYASDTRSFRFASTLRALQAGTEADAAREPAALASFALFGHVPEPWTMARGCRMLEAGHFLCVDRDGAGEPVRFAQLGQAFASPRAFDPDAVRQAVRESVARHCTADVPLGIFLSGGVDSGAVLGAMRDAFPHAPITAVTLCFPPFAGTPADETPLARLLAERLGARHIVRTVSHAEWDADLPRILAAMDQPTVDGINTWFAAKAMREAGVKLALSGIGGDELFCGYSTFTTLPRTLRAARLAASVPGLGQAARRIGGRLAPGLARSNPKALSVFEWGGSWAGAYLLRRGLFLPHELPALLGTDCAREGLSRLDPLRHLGAALDPDPGFDAARVSLLETAHYLRSQLLRDADWAGMAHGVEIRTPLVDWTLHGIVAPQLHGMAEFGGKRLLASVPRAGLPKAVLERPKMGFSVPTAHWLPDASTGRLASRAWARRLLAHVAPRSEKAAA
ncbi:MAG: asparagine synthase (glutamine-hydrolyzing) [Mesorhizobium amorphae]|nr:MAG: asparagine synthase (glutamine-hydrolyzing) [Mesorhizobium amorphae]